MDIKILVAVSLVVLAGFAYASAPSHGFSGMDLKNLTGRLHTMEHAYLNQTVFWHGKWLDMARFKLHKLDTFEGSQLNQTGALGRPYPFRRAIRAFEPGMIPHHRMNASFPG